MLKAGVTELFMADGGAVNYNLDSVKVPRMKRSRRRRRRLVGEHYSATTWKPLLQVPVK